MNVDRDAIESIIKDCNTGSINAKNPLVREYSQRLQVSTAANAMDAKMSLMMSDGATVEGYAPYPGDQAYPDEVAAATGGGAAGGGGVSAGDYFYGNAYPGNNYPYAPAAPTAAGPQIEPPWHHQPAATVVVPQPSTAAASTAAAADFEPDSDSDHPDPASRRFVHLAKKIIVLLVLVGAFAWVVKPGLVFLACASLVAVAVGFYPEVNTFVQERMAG